MFLCVVISNKIKESCQNIYKTGTLSQIQKYIITTLGKLQLYIHSKQNMNLQQKKLKYNLPYTINNTPHIVKDKVNTHSFQGFSLYVKQYLIRKYNTNCISRNCYICEQNA